MTNSDKNTANAAKSKIREKPNMWSRLFIWWMCPVLFKGYKTDVEEEDLVVPSSTYESKKQGDYLERYWFEEIENASRENRKPSLSKVLCRTYWLAYTPGAIYMFMGGLIRSVKPLFLAKILSYWSADSTVTQYEAGLFAIAMLAIDFGRMMFVQHSNLFASRYSLKIKVACSSLLYRKLLRTSQTSVAEVSGGKLINLLSNDIAKFDAINHLHYLWLIPLQTVIVLYLMHRTAGFAPLIGMFAVMMFIMPMQAGLTKLIAIMRRHRAHRTDKRIKLLTEVINGIQIIKMFAWEKPYQLLVEAARDYEMRALGKSNFVKSTLFCFGLFTGRCVMFITILILAFTGNIVTATILYPIQQYFSLIQTNITVILPVAITSFTEMMVSIDRMQAFLLMDERADVQVQPKTINKSNNLFKTKNEKNKPDLIVPISYIRINTTLESAKEDTKHIIEVNNVNASWITSKQPEEITLKNISLSVQKGKLCAIIGPIGSGKTSLLQLFMKELPISKGRLNVKGSVAYACQESWLFTGTVRENILFGLPFDSAKYKEVCRVCCLKPDFEQFPYNDLSLVGDRGMSLSGGQRARINLARTIYRDADIYLLDDPLSAVDPNVGRLLLEECIKGYLKNRTCILVTHQIHYLKDADFIVVMNEGSIENTGTYDELVKSGTAFTALLSSANNSKDSDAENKETSGDPGETMKADENSQAKVQMLEAEQKASGSLKWAVIWQYLSSVQSWCIVVTSILAFLVTQLAITGSTYWLAYWINDVDLYVKSISEGEEPDPAMGTQIGLLTNGQYLISHGCFLLAIIISTYIRTIVYLIMTMRASKNIHNIIYQKLTVTVMRFFNTNPSGRILNRFSKDMEVMDETLPPSIIRTIQNYLHIFGILILNAVALPLTLIPTFVFLVVVVILIKVYLNAAQAVKRLEGTTKSPVLGMVNSTIAGLPTIRCLEAEDRLLKSFDNAQNLHTSAAYTYLGATTAFGLYFDGICVMYLTVILSIFLLLDFGAFIPVGSVGLAISQTMTVTNLLQQASELLANSMAEMTAIERVLEYTNLAVDEGLDKGTIDVPKEWPSKGKVQFENVNLRYAAEIPFVLKNLNFTIKDGWKVGVVGRTGAGKSSLISALLRLTDIEGSIKIDGLDTKNIAKKELRSKLSVIPQEPLLFSATLRHNLDPCNIHSDNEIWRALEQVELKEAIPALDYQVSEGGSNFSMGQRQLVCLARAILRSNKILVIDEATANVDPQTDALIQKTIRTQFASCTVLTIAHRLNTIMDSDRVLVMDMGEAVEFDHPHILLSNPSSKFNLMVNETGEGMAKILREISRNKYESHIKEL